MQVYHSIRDLPVQKKKQGGGATQHTAMQEANAGGACRMQHGSIRGDVKTPEQHGYCDDSHHAKGFKSRNPVGVSGHDPQALSPHPASEPSTPRHTVIRVDKAAQKGWQNNMNGYSDDRHYAKENTSQNHSP